MLLEPLCTLERNHVRRNIPIFSQRNNWIYVLTWIVEGVLYICAMKYFGGLKLASQKKIILHFHKSLFTVLLQSHQSYILKKTDNLDKPGSAACQFTRSLPFPVDVLLLFNCATIFSWHHCLFLVFTTVIIDITCLLVIYVDEVVSLVVYVDSDANVTHSSKGHQCCFKTLFSSVFAQVSLSLYTMMTLLLPDEGYYAGANLGWLDVRSLRHVAFLPPNLCTTYIHLILAVFMLCFCRCKSNQVCTFCQKYFTWFWCLVHQSSSMLFESSANLIIWNLLED